MAVYRQDRRRRVPLVFLILPSPVPLTRYRTSARALERPLQLGPPLRERRRPHRLDDTRNLSRRRW